MRADPAGQSLSAAADSRNAGHAYWQDNEISWFDWAKGGLRADLRVAGLQATFQAAPIRRCVAGSGARRPRCRSSGGGPPLGRARRPAAWTSAIRCASARPIVCRSMVELESDVAAVAKQEHATGPSGPTVVDQQVFVA